jgi:hypothetical protein
VNDSDLCDMHEVLWTVWSPEISDADRAFPSARAPVIFRLRKAMLEFGGIDAAARLTDEQVLDVWAWATFGADDLTLLPRKLRSDRLRAVSERYGIPADSLVWMIRESASWRER